MLLIPTLLLSALPAALPQDPEAPQPPPPLAAAWSTWRQEHGRGWILRPDPGTGTARFLFGSRLEAPFTPVDDAGWFELGRIAFDQAYDLFRLDDRTLVADRVKHLNLSRIGTTDKVSVQYRQEVRGVPVVHGTATALFSPAGELLALDTTGLPDLASFPVAPLVGRYAAVLSARAEFGALEGRPARRVEEPELVIYPLQAGKVRQPRLAWAIEVWNEQAEVPAGRRIYVAADSQAREVLASDNLVHHQDLSGHVEAWASPGTKPDIASNPEALHVMKYLDVTSSVGNATTDANGDFTIPYSGTANVDLTFRFRGPWCRVQESSGAVYSLTQTYSPGVPADALMNPARSERDTAEANAFRCVTDFRDYIKRIDPGDSHMDFTVVANVNIGSTCNAYYNGSSINFYSSGGGCVNTAYSTVIAHEEGHWANDVYGSHNGSDGFGEGNADVFAMYIYDTPIVGENFSGSSYIRSGNNTRQYCGDSNPGCYGEVHRDGEVLMGALWKVRDRLNTTHGNTAGDLIADTLFVAWMNAYNDGNIHSIIEDHWLSLDDNDGNIYNGTPNYADIDGGFRAQGFPGVDLQLIDIVHTPLPDTQNEAGPYTVTADISSLVGATITAARVVYQVDHGAPVTVAMTNTAGTTWSGDIPGQVSPAVVQYHIEAEDSVGNSVSSPRQGDYQFVVGVVTTIYFNDFEGATDEGWTHVLVATQDDWQRGAPQGKSGSSYGVGWQDPPAAYSGNKCWANDLGNPGWNGAYAANVQNRLVSPSIDCSGRVGVKLRFARWLSVEEGIYDQAQIKVNGVTMWANPSNSHITDTGWSVQEVDISSVADNNPAVEIRFTLKSDGGLELGGWAIDDVELLTIEPVPGGTDTIVLSGDSQGVVGGTVSYTFSNAPALSPWWLVRSFNLNGQVFQGHAFDLGQPTTIVASGTTDAAGAGSWTSGPIPAAAAGRTVYLEVAAQSGGQFSDSNPLTLTIQ
ncbi:MAG: hypothetical protein D6702_07225 [Planctomycetota bacterium]|nr:MAG: hypothetical protein D6702_07225 [Planctomycetota bacterium]